jgi:hypothetical protein
MLKQIILRTLAVSAIGVLAIGCSSRSDFGPEDETAASELGADQRGCPQLNITRSLLTGGTDSVRVNGVQASIVENGTKLRCGTTGTFAVGSASERLFMPDPGTTVTPRGNTLEFRPSLPPQSSWLGPARGFIASQTCLYGAATLGGAGFPSVSLPLTTVWETRRDPKNNNLFVTCTVTTRDLALTTNRPKDVISTSGDDFVFRCDLTGSARTRACQNVCNGNAQCLSSCDNNAGCPVTGICDGSDCPSNSCAPENRCSVASDCGNPARFTCTNNCCATIIR